MTDTDLIKIINKIGLSKVAELIYNSSPYNAVDILMGARCSGKTVGALEAIKLENQIRDIIHKHKQDYTLYNAEGFLRCKEMIIYQPGFEDELLENSAMVKLIIHRLLASFAQDVCKELDIKVPTKPKTWANIYYKIADRLQELLC